MVLPLVPPAADLLAQESQREHPWQAAGDGQQGEAPEGHPGDPGGQRDEGPDDGEHPREEDRRIPVTVEPIVGPVEIAPIGVEDPVPLDELQPAVIPDRVGDPGADQIAQDTGRHDAEQRQRAVVDLEPGEQHGRLARDRDQGALERHQHEDAGITGIPDQIGGEVDQLVGDCAGQENEAGHRGGIVGARVLPAWSGSSTPSTGSAWSNSPRTLSFSRPPTTWPSGCGSWTPRAAFPIATTTCWRTRSASSWSAS